MKKENKLKAGDKVELAIGKIVTVDEVYSDGRFRVDYIIYKPKHLKKVDRKKEKSEG